MAPPRSSCVVLVRGNSEPAGHEFDPSHATLAVELSPHDGVRFRNEDRAERPQAERPQRIGRGRVDCRRG